ncbi:MAG TPA: substrate-binding domain-containing protein [Polyangiaceae bacterium]|nr:substrate-binding domain-containing protein [Polyangiaceae bacterium]
MLIDWLAIGYQGDIVQGVARAAAQRGANLLVYFGGAFTDEALTQANNAVYASARHPSVDGVIALAGGLVGALGADACRRILKGLAVPIVSIGLPIDFGASLGVDNHAGLRQLCEHLVQVHGKKRFAMIGGPASSVESEERIQVCRETLAGFGIELSENQVTRQGFQIESGTEGIAELVDRRRLDPTQLDVILCANDLSAEGALVELNKRNRRVPEDLLVTGFDGLDRGRYLTPPLTTIEQPVVDLGYAAGRSLLQALDGVDVPRVEKLPARLLVRGSCGCVGMHDLAEEGPKRRTRSVNSASVLLEQRVMICAALSRAAQGQMAGAGAGWEERWLMALFEDLRMAQGKVLLGQIQSLLLRQAKDRSALELCQRVLLAFRHHVLTHLSDPEATRRLEDIMHEARALIWAALERLEVGRRLTTTGTLYSVLHSIERLVRVLTQAEFWTQLQIELTRLGIHTCFVTRIEDMAPSTSRVVFAFSQFEPQVERWVGEVFPNQALLPGSQIRQRREYPLVVRNLVYSERAVGTAILSLSARDVAIYESFAALIALQLSGKLGAPPAISLVGGRSLVPQLSVLPKA